VQKSGNILKPKKTLSNWLTTRYQLVIRNEENFAEKTSMGFTYSKVILFSVILFTGLFTMSLFMSKTILAKWFDPKHEQMVLNRQLLELAVKVDSLGLEVERKDQFIANFQRVLSGDTSNFEDLTPLHPNRRIHLETTADKIETRESPCLQIEKRENSNYFVAFALMPLKASVRRDL